MNAKKVEGGNPQGMASLRLAIPTRLAVILAMCLSMAGSATISLASDSNGLSFNRDVRPILSDKCFHCHGPDAENQDSSFRLDSAENAFEDLGGYAGIVPGDLEESELHHRIRMDADEDGVMPPEDAVRQLTDAEKDVLDRWIKQGAPFESHWAFESVPATVPVPEVDAPWANHPIDAFVLKRMREGGLSPNRVADPVTWLRRVTFDLTGLPPTVEEIESFEADHSKRPEMARESVVDRLLQSDACAERLASEWLDVARYADSFGYQRDNPRYVWPWRDWVIKAFRDNKPYDEFVTEQLAGDLLPNPTRDQLLATTFNRLHGHNEEGGVAIEEFRVEYVSDRTHTFSAAFMGLTMECARCHDHKYDPIKTKEYYSLSSFFANIDENGLISYFTDATPTPEMPLPNEEQSQQLDAAKQAIDSAARKLKSAESDSEADAEFNQWLKSRQPPRSMVGRVAHLQFESMSDPLFEADVLYDEAGGKLSEKEAPLVRNMVNSIPGTAPVETTSRNELTEGKSGQGLKLTGDDAVVIPGVGHFRRHDPSSFSIWIKPAEIDERGVIYRRSRGWDDAGTIGYELTKEKGRLSAKLVHFWPGNAICVETDEVLSVDKWHHVAVTYDGSSTAAGLKIFVDGKEASSHIVHDSLTREIVNWRTGYRSLAIGARYRDRGFKDGIVDEFQAFNRQLSTLEIQQIFDGRSLEDLMAMPVDQLSDQEDDQERQNLRQYWNLTRNARAETAREDLRQARASWNAVMDATPAIMIMRENDQPKEAFVLTRGAYDVHGEPVTAGTPAFLPDFPEDAPRNRLGLAKWLLSSEHPLTSRVVVNRYWQLLFGHGLVRTPEDFGLQGSLPTHPELLDWLSRDLMENGWDIHRLLKSIVLSSTYRQSSVVSAEVRNKDPENMLFARGPGQRLTAEMVRDNVLAVSGLLVDKVGGEPVKPYDLALAYTPMEVDKGERLYRRSLYTFWKRMSPAPVMVTMNANKREVCRLRREITESPLQSLVLLNGPQFIEASRVMAGRLLEDYPNDVAALADDAFLKLTSRHPNDKEAEILQELFSQQVEFYTDHEDDAKALLKVGDAANEFEHPPAKQAAATILVNTIMNLDESVRNR